MFGTRMIGALIQSPPQTEKLEGAFPDAGMRDFQQAQASAETVPTIDTPKEHGVFGRCQRFQEDPQNLLNPEEPGHDPASVQRKHNNIITFQSASEPADFALAVSKGNGQVPASGPSTTPGWGYHTSHTNYVADEIQPPAKGFEKGGVTSDDRSYAVLKSEPGEDVG